MDKNELNAIARDITAYLPSDTDDGWWQRRHWFEVKTEKFRYEISVRRMPENTHPSEEGESG